MATELPVVSGHNSHKGADSDKTSFTVKTGLARMLRGGVIMDVVNVEQACAYPAVDRELSLIDDTDARLWFFL